MSSPSPVSRPVPPTAPKGIDTVITDYVPDFTRMLYMLYVDQETQISRADTKAQIILSFSAVLIAAVANLGFDQVSSSSNQVEYIIGLGVNLLVLAALGTAMTFAIRVAFPRLRRYTTEHEGIPDVFFSGYISELDPMVYVATITNMTLAEFKEAAIIAIHAKASVLARKYASIQRSMRFAIVAVVIWVLGQALLAIF